MRAGAKYAYLSINLNIISVEREVIRCVLDCVRIGIRVSPAEIEIDGVIVPVRNGRRSELPRHYPTSHRRRLELAVFGRLLRYRVLHIGIVWITSAAFSACLAIVRPSDTGGVAGDVHLDVVEGVGTSITAKGALGGYIISASEGT